MIGSKIAEFITRYWSTICLVFLFSLTSASADTKTNSPLPTIYSFEMNKTSANSSKIKSGKVRFDPTVGASTPNPRIVSFRIDGSRQIS